MTVRTVLAVAAAIVRTPSLWGTALRQWGRLVPPGWWRRPPHLPVPPGAYMEFRLVTQYGDRPRPEADDVLNYLRWCRQWERHRS